MIEQGPGTMWEAWDGAGSRNHPWPGVIDAWLYQMYAGINGASPGYQTLMIKPFVPPDVAWVKATKATPFGPVSSAWRKEQGQLTLDVEIPVGTSATILVPARGGAVDTVRDCDGCARPSGTFRGPAGYSGFKVNSGRYRFTSVGW
jgi:alpha-L-rhamnosidase